MLLLIFFIGLPSLAVFEFADVDFDSNYPFWARILSLATFTLDGYFY